MRSGEGESNVKTEEIHAETKLFVGRELKRHCRGIGVTSQNWEGLIKGCVGYNIAKTG